MEEQTAFPPKYQGSGAKARSFHFSILDLGERRGGGGGVLETTPFFRSVGVKFFFSQWTLAPALIRKLWIELRNCKANYVCF